MGGTITDPSGAVYPWCQGRVEGPGHLAQRKRGPPAARARISFPLLPPAPIASPLPLRTMLPTPATVQVAVGTVSTQDMKLGVEAASQTVTVTAESGVLQTTTPNVTTTMSNEQIQYVPNGGGDLSYMAQTAPGSVMNSQGGLGNFSSNGVPAIANNFTYNSMPENDPFLSLNNSGATNILLGQNDINETSSRQQCLLRRILHAGSQCELREQQRHEPVPRKRELALERQLRERQQLFQRAKRPATPKPFVNDNMWQASFGGPIKKDKTFFFVDTEGLYLLIPALASVNVPITAFQSAVLSNIATVQPTALPLYQSMFNIYNHAPECQYC